jgi:hypothetical protein
MSGAPRLNAANKPSSIFKDVTEIRINSQPCKGNNLTTRHNTTPPFRLKSTDATYQQGIQRCMYSQLGCNAEAYIDDVGVKTREEGLISDLIETIEIQNEAKP